MPKGAYCLLPDPAGQDFTRAPQWALTEVDNAEIADHGAELDSR